MANMQIVKSLVDILVTVLAAYNKVPRENTTVFRVLKQW